MATLRPGSQFNGRPWKSSLLTLYREPLLLISSILFPCGAYHKASACFEKDPADFVESLCGGCCFFCGFDLRSRFRDKYGLSGNEAQDFCIHCWCNCCGLAQIQREARLWKEAEIQKDRSCNAPAAIPVASIESSDVPIAQRRLPASSMFHPITAHSIPTSHGSASHHSPGAPVLHNDACSAKCVPSAEISLRVLYSMPVGTTMAAHELTDLMGDFTQIYHHVLQMKDEGADTQDREDTSSAKE